MSLDLNFTNNPDAVFLAGQVLTGTVVVRLNKAVTTQGLRLIVEGKAECKWKELKPFGATRREYVEYSNEKTLLHSASYIHGSEHGSSINIPAGVHNFNFEFFLPESIPYSLEGKHGSIRYKAKANLVVLLGWGLHSSKPFRVVRHDDLNLVRTPDYRQPCEVEEFKTSDCCGFAFDVLFLRMRVPKTGFGLGELIPIHVKMISKRSEWICATRLELMKVVQYNAPPKFVKEQSVIVSKTSRVRSGHSINFVNFLQIPQVIPTSNDLFCSVFQVTYHIRFTADLELRLHPFNMEIDIAIGNVGANGVAPPPIAGRTPLHPTRLPAVSPPRNPRTSAPPSYEEATRHQP